MLALFLFPLDLDCSRASSRMSPLSSAIPTLEERDSKMSGFHVRLLLTMLSACQVSDPVFSGNSCDLKSSNIAVGRAPSSSSSL